MISQVELNRKAIHLLSLWMPLVIYVLNQKTAIVLFGTLFCCAVLAEVLRFKSTSCKNMLEKVFDSALRANEKNGNHITGATYMLLGVFICTFFPTMIAVTATAILMVSDTAAAIIGQAMGKTKFLGKSLEGCVAFLVSGFCVVVLIGILSQQELVFYVAGALAVLAATLAEIYSRKIYLDDNLTIPVIASVVMWCVL